MQQMPGRDAYLDGLLGLADADSALKDAPLFPPFAVRSDRWLSLPVFAFPVSKVD